MSLEEEALLQSVGLTRNESLVYMGLGALGPASASDVAEKSGVQRTLVYDTLKRLIDKGFVSQVDLDGKKLFKAAEPGKITALVEEQQKKTLDNIAKLVPLLEKSYSSEKRPLVSMYTGLEGLKTVLTQEIDSTPVGGTIMASRVLPNIADMASVFISWWHKKRVAKKIRFQAILDSSPDSLKRGKEVLEKLELCDVRYLPSVFDAPVTYHIYGDKVALLSGASAEMIGIVIESRVFAASFKDNFEYMWLKLGGKQA